MSAYAILRPLSEATSSSSRIGTTFSPIGMNVNPSTRPAPPPFSSRSISRNGPLVKRPTRVLSTRLTGTIARRMRMPVISMVGFMAVKLPLRLSSRHLASAEYAGIQATSGADTGSRLARFALGREDNSQRMRVASVTPGGGGMLSGTKKSGASSRLLSTRYFSKSLTPCS